MKSRRRTTTSNERGLGLLEAFAPQGDQDEPDSTLPPGQRDQGGFWFPAGYTHPGDIFTPAQRKLQARQRQVQRHRHDSRAMAPAGERDPAPPGPLTAEPAERRMPLPAPSPEAPEATLLPRQNPAGHRVQRLAPPHHAPLAGRELPCSVAARPGVDSHRGSD